VDRETPIAALDSLDQERGTDSFKADRETQARRSESPHEKAK